MISIVRAQREDSTEALVYLEEALKVYSQAIANIKKAETDSTELPELSAVDRYLLKPKDDSALDRRIYGGINVRVLENNLTQTYFYCA